MGKFEGAKQVMETLSEEFCNLYAALGPDHRKDFLALVNRLDKLSDAQKDLSNLALKIDNTEQKLLMLMQEQKNNEKNYSELSAAEPLVFEGTQDYKQEVARAVDCVQGLKQELTSVVLRVDSLDDAMKAQAVFQAVSAESQSKIQLALQKLAEKLDLENVTNLDSNYQLTVNMNLFT